MQTDLFTRFSGIRCLARRLHTRRVVFLAFVFISLFGSRTSFAGSRRHHTASFSVDKDTAPGSIDVTNSVGPLMLDQASFGYSGTDAAGRYRDAVVSGHAIGIDRLVFDQASISLRIGVYDHFSIGFPVTFGAAPVGEAVYPTASMNANAIRANGGAALLFGVGVSPGYEINFGDSAFRFDTAILARAVFVPINLTSIGKGGKTYNQSADAAEIAFEPRITILPWARGDLGLGFYGEMNAMHPEDWSCGGVIQLRFGRKG